MINKIATEEPTLLSGLEFTQLEKVKKCRDCGVKEIGASRGPPNSYYLYIDGTGKTVQDRLDSTLTRNRECLECRCDEVCF